MGVARCVYIMCGSVYINGHIFCEGLGRLRLSLDLRSRIGPVAYLIRGALYRPKYELGSRGSISMGELIGMYHGHNATKQHDKVYALLGLSVDPDAIGPKYNLPWKEVFKEVTSYLFPECSVETWNETETVVIRGKGWILGHVHFVEENLSEFGKQKVEVLFNNTAISFGCAYQWGTDWKLQASALLIQAGDIICLLKGASKPSIIRLCKDHFTVITPAVTPQQRQHKESPTVRSLGRLFDIILIWKTPLVKTQSKDKPEIMSPLMKAPPNLQEERFEAQKRLKHTTLVVIDLALRTLEQTKSSTRVIAHLLRQSGTKDPIIEEFVKVLKYKNRPSTVNYSSDLFRDQGSDLLISEETVIAATMDAGPYGCIIMELLLQYQGASLPISEEVVKAIAGNNKDYGHIIIAVLFRHRGKNLPISEEVVKAAAENTGIYRPIILEILFQQ